MKKFFKALGKATLYVLTFVFSQFLVALLFAISVAALLVMRSDVLNNPSGMQDLIERLQQVTLESMNLISILSAVFTLIIFLIAVKARKKSFARETSLVRPAGAGRLLWLMLPAGVALQFFLSGGMSLLPIPQSVLDSYAEMTGLLDNGSILWQVLYVCLLAPLCEEITFRGFAYSRLKKGMPLWLAMVLQALAFGVMHGHPLWISYAALLGVLLVLVYEYFGTLWAPLLVHVALN